MHNGLLSPWWDGANDENKSLVGDFCNGAAFIWAKKMATNNTAVQGASPVLSDQ